ncbi:hypothetical protein CONLIGDRAFT_676332 [Coniochaeta ligniaria NRRL 30616]|uniref:Uncharacterized protein n=1 Tax=Coniochaeta ligniaria NRRL 30616 TaxID=1408157 RepID=A0A1J7K5B4_9PEZI|nr:hypothetical protein CONLIGDRAFT_676332 [Coniochaeta ligniaria NRRL 30616]
MDNGLGHGRTTEEIMVVRATIGQLVLAHAGEDINTMPPNSQSMGSSSYLPPWITRRTYFSDPYAEETGSDASVFVLAGLVRAVTFPLASETIPVMIWLVQPRRRVGSDSETTGDSSGQGRTKLIFQDDGRVVRTASTAVLVAIDRRANDGKKQAHLFVTEPLAQGVVVTEIDI